MKKATLINPKATERAKELYTYLCSQFGKKILSGQQECPDPARVEDEMNYIREVTGKLPAIRGLDYIHSDFAGVNERAKDWWSRGGIVTICWHWGIPPAGLGYQSSQETIDVEEALTEGTELNLGMLRQMDEVAEALKELQAADIPVLWRPLHEFDGQWFWWGKGGPDCFIRLWKLMYDRFTNYHGLNNLIWVLGYSHLMKEGWFPGEEYYDVIGTDVYGEGIHEDLYQWVLGLSEKQVPVAYHECGPMPDPDELIAKKIPWSWFMTWHTIHIKEQNTPEKVRAIYNHDYVITLDRLPQWK